jgi:hypothetical protein
VAPRAPARLAFVAALVAEAVPATVCRRGTATKATGDSTGAVIGRVAATSATRAWCTGVAGSAGAATEVGIAITPAVRAANPAAMYGRKRSSQTPPCTASYPDPNAEELTHVSARRWEMAPTVSPPSDYCDPYVRGCGFRLWDARMILDDAGVTGEWL